MRSAHVDFQSGTPLVLNQGLVMLNAANPFLPLFHALQVSYLFLGQWWAVFVLPKLVQIVYFHIQFVTSFLD